MNIIKMIIAFFRRHHKEPPEARMRHARARTVGKPFNVPDELPTPLQPPRPQLPAETELHDAEELDKLEETLK